MEALKTAWDFFQNEILGMNWLNRLITTILNACGLDTTGKIGASIQFFIYDAIKIMVLLGVLILFISYIQSYFPPERTKKILGRFHGIWANIIAALRQPGRGKSTARRTGGPTAGRRYRSEPLGK